MTNGADGAGARPTPDAYQASFLTALGLPNDLAKAVTTYEFNMRAARASAQSGRFVDVVSAIRNMPLDYLGGKPDLLFYPITIEDDLALRTKPFVSVINKLYRRNIVYNRKWPAPPKDGWIEASNFYEAIDDLLRTRLVCRYMDGPKFVCDSLSKLCDALGVQYNIRTLSTEAGYYAWHFYFKIDVELALDGGIQNRKMWVEVQLTTQLAEVITSLTHGLYEKRREGADLTDQWKWDPASPQFRSSFIGHGLHLLEGVIQGFRDDVLPKNEATEFTAIIDPNAAIAKGEVE